MAIEISVEYRVSITQACSLMEINRSYYYQEKRDDSEMKAAIRKAGEYGDGFWKIFNRLRKEDKPWNHKKVYRVSKAMHYEKRIRLKKRLPDRMKNPLEPPSKPNETLSMDFVSDTLECGRKFRVLNVMDDYDRYTIGQEVSMSMPAKRVIRLLEEMIWNEDKPKNIRCDNGPEFISKDF